MTEPCKAYFEVGHIRVEVQTLDLRSLHRKTRYCDSFPIFVLSPPDSVEQHPPEKQVAYLSSVAISFNKDSEVSCKSISSMPVPLGSAVEATSRSTLAGLAI